MLQTLWSGQVNSEAQAVTSGTDGLAPQRRRRLLISSASSTGASGHGFTPPSGDASH